MSNNNQKEKKIPETVKRGWQNLNLKKNPAKHKVSRTSGKNLKGIITLQIFIRQGGMQPPKNYILINLYLKKGHEIKHL